MGSTRPRENPTEAQRHHRKMRAVQVIWFAWSGGFYLWELAIVASAVLDGDGLSRFLFHLAAAVLQICSLGLAARSWANTTAELAQRRAYESEKGRRSALG